MATNKMKEIAKRAAIEHFSDPEILNELCTPGFIVHFSWGAEFQGIREVIALLVPVIPSTRVVIDDCIAEGDKVVMRFRVFFPLEGGGEVIRNEISILRFEDGKIAEWWAAFDRQCEKEQGGGIDL